MYRSGIRRCFFDPTPACSTGICTSTGIRSQQATHYVSPIQYWHPYKYFFSEQVSIIICSCNIVLSIRRIESTSPVFLVEQTLENNYQGEHFISFDF